MKTAAIAHDIQGLWGQKQRRVADDFFFIFSTPWWFFPHCVGTVSRKFVWKP